MIYWQKTKWHRYSKQRLLANLRNICVCRGNCNTQSSQSPTDGPATLGCRRALRTSRSSLPKPIYACENKPLNAPPNICNLVRRQPHVLLHTSPRPAVTKHVFCHLQTQIYSAERRRPHTHTKDPGAEELRVRSTKSSWRDEWKGVFAVVSFC